MKSDKEGFCTNNLYLLLDHLGIHLLKEGGLIVNN